MATTCKWSVSSHDVDDGMFREAVRKELTDKKSQRWWLEHYADNRSPSNDSDPNEGMICQMEVHSLDDLTTAVRLLRSAQASDVSVVCSIDAPSVSVYSVIGNTSDDLSFNVHAKPIDSNATFRLIADIEERCDELRDYVLSVQE